MRRFEGRGFLAGGGEPSRIQVTAAMLGLAADAASARTPAWAPTWAPIWRGHYYDFENTVILRATLGAARINELALARHYRVSRAVAGDLLNHAAGTGIVVRDERSRWLVNPLDEARFQDLYDLRLLLEPAALRTAIMRVPDPVLDEMRRRLLDASKRVSAAESAELDRLEEDLHVALLNFSANPEIGEVLKRTRCILVAGKHIQRAIRESASPDAFVDEHLEILDAVSARNFRLARRRLHAHLTDSQKKAKDRLRAYREQGGRSVDVPYMLDVS